VIPLAVALLVAIPSPVTAARQILHTRAPLVLRGDIDAESAVIAFGGANPAAIGIEYRNRRWRELPQGGVRVRPLGPDPGSVQHRPVVQLAAQFSSPSRILQAGLWVDSSPVHAKPHGTSTRFTAYGATPRLRAGRHHAVAFAGAPGSAQAKIWTFRVRP
jgi:hypothetical protein